MPAESVAVTTLSLSGSVSSSVATVRVADAWPAGIVTEAGGVPVMVAPLSATPTATTRLAVVSPVRGSVKDAFAPSSTGLPFAAIVTVGRSSSVTVTWVADESLSRE